MVTTNHHIKSAAVMTGNGQGNAFVPKGKDWSVPVRVERHPPLGENALESPRPAQQPQKVRGNVRT
ncbi:MAG TPA: hypothetical protein DDW23_07655 [Planctomycetes bacterium]|nr:hypothetical protein [Planctomycetota bacterium]